jgi:RNA polymerase sigma factor (sigma-70 family)
MEAWAVPPDAVAGRAPLEAADEPLKPVMATAPLEAADVAPNAVVNPLGPRNVRAALLTARGLHAATDAYLVTLVRARRTGAFEAIYDRYHGPILAFCRRLLGDREEAADAAQHTFLAAYSAIVSSQKTIMLKAWLYTIARNRCYSVLRARREQATGELVEPVNDGLAAEVLRREDVRQLLRDLHRLPDDQRAALLLAELGSLSHQEVADVLGVPPGKVKALVFQARESLTGMRVARDTDCSVIREQLATLRGGALRRGNLRRHLLDCPGCQEFQNQLVHRGRRLSIVSAPTPYGRGDRPYPRANHR